LRDTPSLVAITCGLFELDSKGKVVRYSPPLEDEPSGRRDGVLGRDFFAEVMPTDCLQESQSRFSVFMAHGHTTDRFSATFRYEGETIKVQFALATISERAGREHERLALVRVMPELR
jgi:hypothetical protein